MVVAGVLLLAAGCNKESATTIAPAQPAKDNVLDLLQDAKREKARLQAHQIEMAIKTYMIRENFLEPVTLQELVEGAKPLLDGGKDAIIDPWGQPFQFGIHTKEKGDLSVDVWTTAPDGARIDNSRKR
jgi:hypothetical protein